MTEQFKEIQKLVHLLIILAIAAGVCIIYFIIKVIYRRISARREGRRRAERERAEINAREERQRREAERRRIRNQEIDRQAKEEQERRRKEKEWRIQAHNNEIRPAAPVEYEIAGASSYAPRETNLTYQEDKWSQLTHKIVNLLEDGDVDETFALVGEMLDSNDLQADAVEIHKILDLLVYYLYKVYPGYRRDYEDEIMALCEIDVSNYENYIQATADNPDHRVYVIPTYYAILLERNDRYDEAIELCEYCAVRGIPDHGYGDFQRRRSHLIHKKARTYGKINVKPPR